MAHRALVAYERAEGRYDVHTSRWGGLDCRLVREITPTDPYASGAVDPVPRVVARPFADVLTMVDLVRHEAVYRVSADYSIRTYLPLWFGLEHYLGDSPDPDADSEGVLVAVESPQDATELRQWLRGAKGLLAEAVTADALRASELRSILASALRRRAAGREILYPGRPSRTSGY